jgi:hypothetical protein
MTQPLAFSYVMTFEVDATMINQCPMPVSKTNLLYETHLRLPRLSQKDFEFLSERRT